MQNSKTDLV